MGAALKLPTQEWKDERAHYIGGSDVAAVLGLSRYKTPLMLWREKKGLVNIQDEIPIAKFGNLFEPVMAAHFSETTGLKVRQDNSTREHKQYPFLRANVDRVVVKSDKHSTTGILELKTTNSYAVKNWDGGQIPIEWEYQIQHYLNITGYDYAYLQVYERDTCLFHEPRFIPRDQELINEFTPKLVAWWYKHMIGNVRPDPVSDEDLMILHPEAKDGKTVQADAQIITLWDSLRKVKVQKTRFEALESELETQIKAKMQDADILSHGDQILATWKNTTSCRLDSTALKEQQPAIYSQYQKTTTTRRFVCKT
jgi:putative phage-type endonuclease